jgi:hypothetical protein
MTKRSFGCMGLSGCLGSIAILLLVGGMIAGVVYVVMGAFKSSPVYLEAMKAAQSDPRIVEALGTPIQAGWLVTGSIEEQGISGDASLNIPISGPRGSGTLYASARKGNGVWRFYTLAVQVDKSNQVIALSP